jgi:hypothetical protein
MPVRGQALRAAEEGVDDEPEVVDDVQAVLEGLVGGGGFVDEELAPALVEGAQDLVVGWVFLWICVCGGGELGDVRGFWFGLFVLCLCVWGGRGLLDWRAGMPISLRLHRQPHTQSHTHIHPSIHPSIHTHTHIYTYVPCCPESSGRASSPPAPRGG